MNKKGVVIEIGAIILILLTTAGIYYTVTNLDNLYIGNKETSEYFDYYKCKDISNSIPEENVIVFKSKVEANKSGFIPNEGCI